MHDVTLLQEIQRKEKLFSVYPDGPDVQTNILAKAFNDISEVHTAASIVKVASRARSEDVPQRFEDKTEVSTMFKRSLQPDNVFFVIWIGLLKLIQHLYFLKARFVPKKKGQRGTDAREKASPHGLLAPDDLDSNLLASVCGFPADYPSTYHVGEHPFAERGENLVATAIKLFAEDH